MKIKGDFFVINEAIFLKNLHYSQLFATKTIKEVILLPTLNFLFIKMTQDLNKLGLNIFRSVRYTYQTSDKSKYFSDNYKNKLKSA